MGDENNRVLPFETNNQILDGLGGTGVQRAGGLVHEDHFGFQCQGARQTKPLLLPDRESVCVVA
jgi:hypothetical protein